MNLAASLRFTVDLTDGFRTGRENGIVFLDSETTGLQKVLRSFGDAAIYGMAEMAPAHGGKTSAPPPFTDTVRRDCVHPDSSLHCAPHQGQCTSAAPLAHSCISGPRVFHRGWVSQGQLPVHFKTCFAPLKKKPVRSCYSIASEGFPVDFLSAVSPD